MFGRPKTANGLFLSQEVGRGLEIISNTFDREHPNATPTDFQVFSVWIFAVLTHVIGTLGRTDQASLTNVAYSFGSAMSEIPPEGRWPLDKLANEIEHCQKLLRANVGADNWGGLRDAAREYYQRNVGIGEVQFVPEAEFVKIGSTIGMAWVDRLRQSGHIKLR